MAVEISVRMIEAHRLVINPRVTGKGIWDYISRRTEHTMSLHDAEELYNDLAAGSDEDLSLAGFFGVVDGFEGIIEHTRLDHVDDSFQENEILKATIGVGLRYLQRKRCVQVSRLIKCPQRAPFHAGNMDGFKVAAWAPYHFLATSSERRRLQNSLAIASEQCCHT